LKILITTFTYPPNADGVAEASAVLAQGLARRGHAVTVATEFHPERKPNAPDANPRVEQFKITGYSNWRIGIRGETDAYQKFLRSFSGDLAVFETWDAWCTHLAVPCLGEIKAKKVLVSHGFAAHIWKSHRKFPWGLGYWMGGWPLVLKMPLLMRKFHQVVFLSQRRDRGRFFDHRMAHATGCRNYSIIPNGVHWEDLQNARTDFRQAYHVDSKYLLLNVANYCDRKNQLATIRDFMPVNHPEATLVFIGSEFNDYSQEMNRLYESNRARYPQAKVVLLEKVTKEMINAAYRTADVFILSAKQETQPLAILDAMASGVPFISTAAGCVAEFPGGWVVPSGRKTTQAIQRFLSDPILRHRLGREGQSACKANYDWNRVIDAYENLFGRLLAS
jgi:glycosyltransferase involved in cell wall biosynthesis